MSNYENDYTVTLESLIEECKSAAKHEGSTDLIKQAIALLEKELEGEIESIKQAIQIAESDEWDYQNR